MKKLILSIAAVTFLMAHAATAQALFSSEIPSAINSEFQKSFPEAKDIEWEMDGNRYNVEFEIGFSTDHEIWYDSTGKVIRHDEEIGRNDLPAAVKKTLKNNFDGYRASDIEKITSSKGVVYTMELDALMKEELEVAISDNGKVLRQKRD